jgi:Spy/CpxP family protein refolding chaperone
MTFRARDGRAFPLGALRVCTLKAARKLPRRCLPPFLRLPRTQPVAGTARALRSFTYLHAIAARHSAAGRIDPYEGAKDASHQEDRTMLGFVIGAVCTVGLIKAIRHRRRRLGWGPRGYGRGSPVRWALGALFRTLRATPQQEEAISSALRGLRSDRQLVREEVKQTRRDLAQALRSGLVDDAAFEEAFARHDRLLAQLRVTVVEAAKQAAEVLDEEQRKVLADRLEGGGFFRGSVWSAGPTVWA